MSVRKYSKLETFNFYIFFLNMRSFEFSLLSKLNIVWLYSILQVCYIFLCTEFLLKCEMYINWFGVLRCKLIHAWTLMQNIPIFLKLGVAKNNFFLWVEWCHPISFFFWPVSEGVSKTIQSWPLLYLLRFWIL